MEYAINQDHRIAFDTFGSGPVVVLHHGWLGNRRHWQDLGYVEALQNEFTVVTLDARAHGDSDIPTDLERYQRSDLADDTSRCSITWVLNVLTTLDTAWAPTLGSACWHDTVTVWFHWL